MKKQYISILIISLFCFNIYPQKQIVFRKIATDLPHSEKLQYILERLGIQSFEVLHEDSQDEIWTGTTTCLEVPAYFKVFWEVQENMTELTLRIKPLQSMTLSPSQIHPNLDIFNSSFEVRDPLIEISTSRLTMTITGDFLLHGTISNAFSFTGLERLVGSLVLPLDLDPNSLSLTLSSMFNKSLLNMVHLDKISLQFFAENFIPKSRLSFHTTYTFPHCPPIQGTVNSTVTTQSELSFAGSLEGAINAPFGIPIQLNKVGASIDTVIAGGMIPTGCGMMGEVSLTHSQKKPRTVALGCLYNVLNPTIAFKGGLSYLCASDTYNLFPAIMSQVPLVIKNIENTLDTYPDLIKEFENNVKSDVAQLNRHIDTLSGISADVLRHFDTAESNSYGPSLVKERGHIESQITQLLDLSHQRIEVFHKEAMQMRKHLQELLGLNIAYDKLAQLGQMMDNAKIPDFFCLNDVVIIIAPRAIKIGDIAFKQGFHLKGELSFAGLHGARSESEQPSPLEYAKMPFTQFANTVHYLYGKNHRASIDLSITPKGLTGRGTVSPINFSFAGINLFKITHNEDHKKGPEASIKIGTDGQEMKLNGRVNLLNQIETAAEITFDLEKAEMELSGHLFSIFMELSCSASLVDLSEWVVEGTIKHGISDVLSLLMKTRKVKGKSLSDYFSFKHAYFRVALIDLATGVLPELRVTAVVLGKQKTFSLPSFDLKKVTNSLQPLVDQVSSLVE